MVEAEGRFAKQYKGVGNFARVMVQVAQIDGENTAEASDDCIDPGYSDWRRGSIAGALYGLKVANASGYAVTITEILGTEVDTTPAIVGIAAMFAVWKAIGYEASAEYIAELHMIGVTSWKLPPEEFPFSV